MDLERIESAVVAVGLQSRGGFVATPEDQLPPARDGQPAETLVLVGAQGGGLWPAFSASPEFADGEADPLDRWSRRTLEALAEELGAAAVFPFGGPPFWPFQSWARRAEPLSVSPLGLLIHPRFGLWHSYRGALVFAERLALPPLEAVPSPCESCRDRPCLSACPVSAFGEEGYNVPRCRAHLSSCEAEPCFEGACLARRACPVGAEWRYDPPQARFHMGAFHRAVAGR